VGRFVVLVLLLAAGCGWPGHSRPAPAIDRSKVVDLTYTFDHDTIYWPTAKSFTMEKVAYGMTERGYFYAANNMCLAEHGGTHMDAPIHFAAGGLTADTVPLRSCIGPAVVVDVRAQAAADRDYRLQVADLTAWESEHGKIPAGAIVLLRTGWGGYWGDKARYLGTAKPGDVANLHFPSYSKESAEFLVTQRDVAAIGIDTASIDYGPSTDFPVHRVFLGTNRPAFENVANLDRLPATGATVIALPMKIGGGSGGPTRIVAILP
jgi:kynurenine formamidase